MTLAGLLLIATLIMKLWPETGSAQWLHRTLVERPLTFLGGLERRHLVFLIVLLALAQGAALIGSMELATLTAIDVSVYVDAVITAWTVAALSRSRGAWTATLARLPRLRNRKPRQRRVRPSVQRKASNDDDGHGTFALAA
ncbi:MAG: hypothetical protein J7485_01765 [Sphingobium sp.]|nr:hypothetical protein [Sphingobium sp.]